MSETTNTDLVIIGSGPGGYSAAFRAADLGLKVTLIEREKTLGGVCLNVGCIPSKALLHIAKVMDEVKMLKDHGVVYGEPKIDNSKLRDWKNTVISKLTTGLGGMAKMRKVNVIQGEAQFASPNQLTVKTDKGDEKVDFKSCIIAVGSEPVKFPFIPDDPRIFDSTGALELNKVDGSMLVMGGGIIGLEMANVYSALGVDISIVEFMHQLIPAADKDLVKTYHKYVEPKYKSIMLETKVTKVEAKKDGIHVTFEGKNAPEKPVVYDQMLYATGRRPNGDKIAADKAGVTVDDKGFIHVDEQLRTNVPHIYAIGDVVGNPMLAHKSVPQGRVAAEIIAGKKHVFDPRCIPSVAYTDPEIAWVGVTEKEAKEQGIEYGTGVFPWAASGRALSNGRSEGFTKMLFDKKTNRVIGGAIIGTGAGDLISEVALAIEMGCDAEDIALTIHPHPTLSESVMIATEAYEGVATDLPPSKKKK